MIVAIDVVGAQAGIAWQEGRDSGWIPLEGKRPSAALLPGLAECMKFGPLETIGVVTGPGSFTGIRTGIATALGLKAAKGLQVKGLDKFQIMAHHSLENGWPDRTFLIPARNDRVYSCTWARTTGLGHPIETKHQELQGDSFLTTAAIPGFNFELLEIPFAKMCLDAVAKGCGEYPLNPLYIRPADTRSNPTYIEKLLSKKT